MPRSTVFLFTAICLFFSSASSAMFSGSDKGAFIVERSLQRVDPSNQLITVKKNGTKGLAISSITPDGDLVGMSVSLLPNTKIQVLEHQNGASLFFFSANKQTTQIDRKSSVQLDDLSELAYDAMDNVPKISAAGPMIEVLPGSFKRRACIKGCCLGTVIGGAVAFLGTVLAGGAAMGVSLLVH